MTTANELITRSLRLINFPGRGSSLAPEDLTGALEALQELLDSKAVSKQLVPGIHRHFFAVTASQGRYTWGAASGVDLDSSPFGLFTPDPAPIKIESCIVRQGATITDHEEVDEYRFDNTGTWVLVNATISNHELSFDTVTGTATQPLTVDVTGATTYTLRIAAQVDAGTVTVQLRNNSVAFETYVLDASGQYEFDVLWPAGIVPSVLVATSLASDTAQLTMLSLIERGRDRLELTDDNCTDYVVRAGDQTSYNNVGVKGIGQTWPSFYLYTRTAGAQRTTGFGGPAPGTRRDPIGQLSFDSAPAIGTILLFDVLVNTIQVNDVNDTLNVTPETIRWLRYALADNVAGEYGKMLSPRQLQQMDEAWDAVESANRRINNLRVPGGLGNRTRYNINGGDR